MAHGLVHFAAITEAHLNFGGVDVHIHTRGVNRHVQGINGLAVAMQHILIGAACGVGDDFVAHIAAVHIGKLVVGTGACGIWNTSASHHGDVA